MKKLIGNIKGFTLTELVVTTAIMGTLAAVAVPSFIETNLKAKSEKTMANLSDIGSAVGQKFNDLATVYGNVTVFPDAATGTTLTRSTVAVRAWNGNAFTYSTQTDTDEKIELLLGDVIPNVPVSPFDDKPYVVALNQQAAVDYSEEDGNIVVTVTKAKVNYSDPEAANMKIDFAY